MSVVTFNCFTNRRNYRIIVFSGSIHEYLASDDDDIWIAGNVLNNLLVTRSE